MTLESIVKLRELRDEAARKMVDNPRWVCARAEEIADEIEREIAERYMELPKDADGVPVRIGDKMTNINKPSDEYTVTSITESGCRVYGDCAFIKTSQLRHIKPRTVEDVLEEFLRASADVCAEANCELEEQIARYADELRDLIKEGGDD